MALFRTSSLPTTHRSRTSRSRTCRGHYRSTTSRRATTYVPFPLPSLRDGANLFRINRPTSSATSSRVRVLSRATFELCSKVVGVLSVRSLLLSSFPFGAESFPLPSRRLGRRRWRADSHSRPHPHFQDSRPQHSPSHRSIRLPRIPLPCRSQRRSALRSLPTRQARRYLPRNARR
jgi:hypothetical protein